MSKENREEDQLQKKEIIFQAKHVVITGADSGIGRALAERFSQLGAVVSAIDIKTDSTLSESITSLQADVTKKEQLEAQLGKGKIDLLIIAAGVTSLTNNPTKEEIALMEAVNVGGVQNTLKTAEPLLSEGAQIVDIGSHDPPKEDYAKTKRKGADLVRNFAQHHPQIKSTIILLGPVNTPLFQTGKPPEVIQRIRENVGLYEPEEFAEELIDILVERAEKGQGLEEITMYKKLEN